MLELLEDSLSYPLRFQLNFKIQENIIDARSQKVTVRFNGVHPPTTDTIFLENQVDMLLYHCYYIYYQTQRTISVFPYL